MTLPVVAVAGGTSQLGLAIVQALLQDGAYTPIVLSRQGSKTPKGLMDLGVEVRRVEYLSPESCDSAVQGVHTVSSMCQLIVDVIDHSDHLDAPLQGRNLVSKPEESPGYWPQGIA